MLLPTRVLDDSGKRTDNWVIIETTTGETDLKQYDIFAAQKQILESPTWIMRQLAKEMMVA